MALPPPPHAVRALMERGFDASPTREQTTALTRWFHRLLLPRSAEANDALVAALHAIVDRSAARLPEVRSLACAKGCSACCHAHVSLFAPEAFALARQIRGKARFAGQRQSLTARVARQALRTPDKQEAARERCAMLVDGMCSTYLVRPLTCRMNASLDRRACEIAMWERPVPIPEPQSHGPLRALLGSVLCAAMQAAGLPVRAYEMTATLERLMREPQLEDRWYAGDDPFASGGLDELPARFVENVAAFVTAAGL